MANHFDHTGHFMQFYFRYFSLNCDKMECFHKKFEMLYEINLGRIKLIHCQKRKKKKALQIERRKWHHRISYASKYYRVRYPFQPAIIARIGYLDPSMMC